MYHKFPNSLKGRIDILTELAGDKFVFKVMKWSPFVVDFKVAEKGSGNFRSNITGHVLKGPRFNQAVTVPLKRV